MTDNYCSDDPRACDFQIEIIPIDKDGVVAGGRFEAVCQKCGRHESPWAMNDMVKKLNNEFDTMYRDFVKTHGILCGSCVNQDDCRDENGNLPGIGCLGDNFIEKQVSKLCLTCRWSGGGCQDEAHFSGSECVTYQHFSALNGKIDELQEEMELGKINYRRLCRVRDSMQAELEKERDDCNMLREEIDMLMLKNERLQAELEQARSDRDKMQSHLSAVLEQFDKRVETELAPARQKIKELQAELSARDDRRCATCRHLQTCTMVNIKVENHQHWFNCSEWQACNA